MILRFILPVVFVVAAGGLFFGYLDPTYETIKTLRFEEAEFDEALSRSEELREVKDRLLTKYNTFTASDLERLAKLLPDNVDNVRLILDLDGIASSHGMRVRNVAVQSSEGDEEDDVVGPPKENAYESVVLAFSTDATYEQLLPFLADLERSLRLVDVTELSFSETETDTHSFVFGVRTYWLR